MNLADREQYQQFQDAFRTYYNQLCNYALTFTRDADVSEDLVQDLFIKIWESRRHLLSDSSIRYYLFTAIRNNCISWLRREKQLVIVPWTDQDAAAEPEVYPKETPEPQKDEMVVLQQAVGLLPPKCREVFLLSRFSNLSYKEIATELNISQKTVENQLSKALKIIRAFLKQSRIYLMALITTIITTIFLIKP